MLFNDQFQVIQNMMKGWSDCELTICAYFMIGQVKPFQGRFLVNSFQHGLKKSPGAREIEVCENEANNEEFMRGAMKGAMQYEIGAEFLRKRILLLHAGNEAPKKIFLNILPTFLNRSDLVEEMREILSYCLIHPAFTQEERKMLDNWVFSLSSSQMKVMDVAAAVAAAAAADSTSQQQHMDNSHTNGFSHLDWNNVAGLGDSLALTSNAHDSFGVPNHQQHMNQQRAIVQNDQQRKNSNYNSLSSMSQVMRNNCMLTNNNSLTGSVGDNSYHHQQENNYHTQMIQQQQNNGVQQTVVKQNGIGMESTGPTRGFFADVQVWLKSLRLHKYAELFSEMTYDEMMELTPEKLDEKNVTKGARNKIILSIKRLRDRFGVLKQLEEDIHKGEPLRTALLELKNMIHTPIKHYGSNDSGMFNTDNGSKNDVIAEDDIPSQYTKVMGKACTQLLTSKPDEENISMYVRLLDRCIQHPSFTEVQKRRLRSWRQQTQKMHRSLSRNMRPLNNSNKNKMRNKFDRGNGSNNNVGQQQPNSGSNSLDSSQICRAPQGMFQQNMQQRSISRSQFQPHSSNSAPRQMNSLMNSSSGLRQMDLNYHQNQMWYNSNGGIQSSSSSLSSIDTRRAASLDPRLGHRMFPGMDDDIPNELNTRLDSLCLSVAEHALSDVAADLKLDDKFSNHRMDNNHRLDNNEPDW